ncbi:hypothetical protein [Okeania sp. KiyG1]|uniref:hypothetical protein n=1 Tax=Okeania sp. KiyG1 TaxID=2720165 RepID=UPI001989C7C4|nr:hypothetical protein [Okeania sp. KiyG1]GGA45392.1 hypothetical protein CYANOKiyG1_64260 [Okeania sp. KiyG1]GGA45889.1 hypothetical protein CYANOKiyG1_64840 [Okeania sp. KiyG1]GGA46501.1 hypothetical protein CYANOKiyG1_65520 [Okeania sp. KiyG1]
MKRDCHLRVRLTFSEYNVLKALAERSEKSLSSVVREKLFTPNCLTDFIEQRLKFRKQQVELQTLLHLVRDLISTEEFSPQTLKVVQDIQCLLDEHHDW